MITGAHAIIFNTQPDEVRAFFRDVLGFKHVDAGGGWLIFALPPAELGVHPVDADGHQGLCLMCDDTKATVKELKAKGVEFTREITDARFGLLPSFKIPGGAELSLSEPKH